MRGLIAVLTLFVAFCGSLVVVVYGVSEVYFRFRQDEARLYDQLVLGSEAESGWMVSELTATGFNEQFAAPCLQTPLLDGIGVDGRGAAAFRPPSGDPAGVRVLVVQTAPVDARSVMADVARDTENDCRRGTDIGTVEQASVLPATISGADDAVFVTFVRRINGEPRRYLVGFLHESQYLARLTYELREASTIAEPDVLALANSLAGRLESPPGPAQLEAAGVVDDPTIAERVAQRVNDESSRIVTVSGRWAVEAGLVGFGGVVLVLHIIGARLNRVPRMTLPVNAPSSSPVDAEGGRYGTPERRWITASTPPEPAAESFAELPAPEQRKHTVPPEAPEPVFEFAQQPIEEQLRILKEARPTEPPRHQPVTPAHQPDVDWTEEISRPRRSEVTPQPQEPISRKELLKKLRAQSDEQR